MWQGAASADDKYKDNALFMMVWALWPINQTVITQIGLGEQFSVYSTLVVVAIYEQCEQLI